MKELDEGQEVLELLSDEDWVNKLPKRFTYMLKMVQYNQNFRVIKLCFSEKVDFENWFAPFHAFSTKSVPD